MAPRAGQSLVVSASCDYGNGGFGGRSFSSQLHATLALDQVKVALGQGPLSAWTQSTVSTTCAEIIGEATWPIPSTRPTE
jgi:hypothetical protein